ncbi:MAG: guanylate kinase [Pseudomonadales bacterium]|nr:guanylate kinase [Pseudomonadales bacterium]
MSEGLLILVSAPSGAGKTSLVAAALKADSQLVVSVSHTTRPQRPGEEDAINYHFVSHNEFDKMVGKGAFLEHALVFGNQYGTSAAAVSALRQQGRDVVLEIDWQGAEQIMGKYPDALSIFILPPDEATLRERLTSRGQDSTDVIEHRLSEARLEISQAPKYEFVIINDDFEQATDDLVAVIRAARLTAARQIEGNPAVQAILSGS